MRKQTLVFVSIMALAIGGALFAVPSFSQADPITITDVSVTVGGITWCGSSTAGACTASATTIALWNTGLGASGITLLAGQSLILTQTGGAASYNFDSSQRNGLGTDPDCNSTNPCTTSLLINKGAVTLGGAGINNLADNNADTNLGTTNEATNWGSAGTALTFGAVYFGYADNIHSNACLDGGNCLPSVGSTVPTSLWGPGTGVTFIGGGTSGVGLGITNTLANHCSTSVNNNDCFDGGAILIYNTQVVPEPVTMFLGGTGLLLLGYAARRRLFVR